MREEVTSNKGSSDKIQSPVSSAGAAKESGNLALGHFKLDTFLIACGGTGGHLTPGIALAEELVARGHAATLLISEKQVDARLAAKYPHLRFRRIAAAPFSLQPRGLIRFLVQQARGLGAALRLVRASQPAAIVGFGGFTTAAVGFAGVLCGVPVALHEANRVPGRATRLMAPLARRIYLPLGVGAMRSARVRAAGMPVRREIAREPRESACAALGLAPGQRVVVVLGGSQGASVLNEWARREAAAVAAAGVQLCVVTGMRRGGSETLRFSGPAGASLAAVFLPFCDRMATLLSVADLVVSRAGAGTIAELVRCRVPAILVPYPLAADNHQAANAAHFEEQGAGIVLEQCDLTRLTEVVLAVVRDDARLAAARDALERLDRDDAVVGIADDLERLAQHGRRASASSGPDEWNGPGARDPKRDAAVDQWRSVGSEAGAQP